MVAPPIDFSCSFCRRGRLVVRKLVTGPRVFICDDCTTRAQLAVTRATTVTTDPPATSLPATPVPHQPCSFCGQHRTDVRVFFEEAGTRICNECLDLCDGIIAEEFAGEWPEESRAYRERITRVRLLDATGADLGVLSVDDAIERAAAADGILIPIDARRDPPVFALARVRPLAGNDDRLVLPKVVLSVRTLYPSSKVDSLILEARQRLSCGMPCRLIVILDGPAGSEDDRAMRERLAAALADLADVDEEQAAVEGAALVLLALPRPASV